MNLKTSRLTYPGKRGLFWLFARFAGIFLVALFTFSLTNQASAVTYQGPEDTRTRYVLEDSPTTVATSISVPVYYRTNPGNVTVTAKNFARHSSRDIRVSFNGGSWMSSDSSFVLPGSSFVYDASSGWYKSVINAQMHNYSGQNWRHYIHFQLELINTAGYIGYGGGSFQQASTSYPLRAPASNYSLTLATPCNIGTSQTRNLQFYDLDSGNIDNGGYTLTVNVYNETTNTLIANRVGGRDAGMGQGETLTIPVNFVPRHKYRVDVIQVSPNNVIQYNFPYDNIAYTIGCNYDVYPRISYEGQYGNNIRAIVPGQSLTLTAQLFNNGVSATDRYVPRSVYEFIIPSSQSIPNFNTIFNQQKVLLNNDTVRYREPGAAYNQPGQVGCAWLATVYSGAQNCRAVTAIDLGTSPTPTGNSWQSAGLAGDAVTINADDYSSGDVVCRFMAVRRFDNSHTTNPENYERRVSLPTCVRIGKKPKVQVLGGDLWVGRSGTTASTVSTSVTLSAQSGLYYGSYAEYAIAATGLVSGMASGSGFANGTTNATHCLRSLLTLNNSAGGVCSDATVGNYSHLPSTAPQIASRFPTTNASPSLSGTVDLAAASISSGVYRARNNGEIQLSTATIPAGKWVVINAPNNDVRIVGNLTYTNDALTSLSQIPQVVIIARNILINESVQRADAWLLASGSGTHGRVNTCSANDLDNATPAQLATRLHSGRCTQQLIVNGPVVANHLLLRRTAGAGPGVQAGIPAEVFNLRPDAYLWLIERSGAGRGIPTVTTHELPPKY